MSPADPSCCCGSWVAGTGRSAARSCPASCPACSLCIKILTTGPSIFAIQLFDDLLYELSSQAKGLTSQNIELCKAVRNVLQTMVQLLETLTGCVRHICTLQEPVPLESIRSLPSSILYVIKNTFMHCKDSESLYSGCLHLISDLLQSLFKETYSLQKQLMELLDMISMESASAEDSIVDMVSVIHTVLEICSVISNMDHALHANTWKFIIKQSLKHHSLLQSHLKHTDILSGLCKDTLVSFHSCLQLAEQMKLSGTQESTDYKLFQRTVKLCRFFANSLVHYIKEFIPFLSDSCCRLHQLYLQIYSKFPPSLYAPVISEAHRDEIARVFLVALDPFVHQLLPFRPFLEQVLSEKLDLSPELHLPQCHLLVTVMDKLPSQPEDVQSLWITGSQLSEEVPRLSLFSALFLGFQQCSGELSLPVCLRGVMDNGQAEVRVTLYHHLCVHLCAFIASTPPSHFPQLERALLDAVLGSSMITSLLAMDSWCFLARYGTAELCAHHVFVIAHLVSSQPCLQQTLCLLLPLLEFFIQKLDPQLITQVFAMQASLFELDPPDHVRLATLDLLSSMGKLFMPQEIQGQVIPKLSYLFASLLADKTWLIYQHALEAFTQFAEATRHEDVVPQCLNSEEIKNKVVCFLAKARQEEETAEARAERMKQEKAVCSVHLLKMKINAEPHSPSEPLAKRACHSPCEEQYKSAIDAAESALEAVKLLLQKSPSPAWLAVKLEALQTAVAILRNAVR
ncbi:FIGNL1-interacting regulator of recombination and mitosis isoform X4 [Chelonoidis abingdonii]|uniref:FIGNL1-interacting regulator of recombination and mitosis isoform X4 n=1 Tax=Chelonoidis abingdonii TaxID=106734 RepID=UPI003F494622